MKKLDFFEKPSRYLGGEIGATPRPDTRVRLNVALAFPDVYEIGMSHVGLKILYGLINRQPDFRAERVFAPWVDYEAELRAQGQPLTSLESGRPLKEFDLIGFSLQYELSYTNVLNMIELGGVPLLARDRGPGHPLVIGGGPNALNPEPLADFFDLFFLGEAEAGLLDLLADMAAWKESGGSRAELLARLADRPGVYVPSLFEPDYGPDGRLTAIRPLRPGYETVRRVLVPDLERAYFPDRPVVPFTKPVHDRIALEIARGCTRGCRFCQAGFIYRPARERQPATILDLAARGLNATGMDEVAFLSLSAGDYSCLNPLMAGFMDRYDTDSVALSLPSLRVKSLNPEMMRQIKRVRKTGFTLAPEAATDRLRAVINKDLTDDDLLTAARAAFGAGWRIIKLYFLLGLPTETPADVEAIADLARRVKAGTRAKVNVSFAVLVPKPHTPFQWEPMLPEAEMRSRLELLKGRLRGPGFQPKWNPVESSLIEGLLSRGDRRLGPVLQLVYERGARFDAWNDRLRLDLWREALTERGLTLDEYLRAREVDEILPWSHLDSGVSAEYLLRERERAGLGQTTPDCRSGDCQACGVCDFDSIQPRLAQVAVESEPALEITGLEPIGPEVAGTTGEESSGSVTEQSGEEAFARFLVNYAKDGPARLLSHLETVDVFLRAMRRAGLKFRMSQGFHPQPRLAFTSPLSVGLASRDEYLIVDLLDGPTADQVGSTLTAELPVGLSVLGVRPLKVGDPKPQARGAVYRIQADQDIFDANCLSPGESVWVTKKSKKGPVRLDIRPLLGETRVLTPRTLDITLFAGPEGGVRPLLAVAALFGLTAEDLAAAVPVKIKTILR